MLRGWEVLPYFATFLTIREKGVGGTELQLLLHARALRDLGHNVTVVGVTMYDTVEEEILFQGSKGKQNLLEVLKENHRDTDVVFTNVAVGLSDLMAVLPKAKIVQVCQNGPCFDADKYIDLYAFVGHGQFCYYAVKFKKYRQKFMMLPNVPPWHTLYSGIEDVTKKDQIIWVGSFSKQGLRRWAKAMKTIMTRYKTLKWVLCGPSYDTEHGSRLLDAFLGIDLPIDRLTFKNLTLPELALEIKRSKIMLASLGGEDGPVSYLEGHAVGVPVLCGDDIIGKHNNPEGLGLRCTTTSECEEAIEFLLANPEVCQAMGVMGRKWIIENMTEKQQKGYIEQLLAYLSIKSNCTLPAKHSLQSDSKFSLRYWLERLEIKVQKRFGGRFK
jgi:glycosyltransferase involved in cell wall biosynthesis